LFRASPANDRKMKGIAARIMDFKLYCYFIKCYTFKKIIRFKYFFFHFIIDISAPISKDEFIF